MPEASCFEPLPDGVEPSAELMAEIIDTIYKSITVSGMGEDDPGITFGGAGDPLLRVDDLCEAVRIMRERRHGVPVRVMTNGLFDAEVAVKLAECGVNQVSVLLASSDPTQYQALMDPQDGKGLGDVCNFVVSLAELGVNVECTAVKAPGVQVDAVQRLAMSLGATEFKAREYFE
eukprot:TRINITY_DN18938_c0_g1_i1.p1 TRINITY_DN18938_c0_g1~~TRINITY_DN18938_c0_g1_i1.p1  ORF type:complete len:175 (+),score=36.11 TRINITY_DN18938_c0_g1_i1:283-807(+)